MFQYICVSEKISYKNRNIRYNERHERFREQSGNDDEQRYQNRFQGLY